MLDDKVNSTVLDGTMEEQKKTAEAFFNSGTKEEYDRAMSSEFSYLDED